MKSSICMCAVFVALAATSCAVATDWITSPSTFTHDPRTGLRTNQFAPLPPVYHHPLHERSVYRQARSSLQVGDSIDQYHVVEEYGHPVRPYGEWRYPFRPFSVPFHLWGSGYGGNGHGGYGHGGYGYAGPGYSDGIGSPFGRFGAINGAGFPPPWNDGSYPDVRRQQLPPQGFAFPSVNNTTNNTTTNINGDENDAASNSNNQSPNTDIDGDHNNVNHPLMQPAAQQVPQQIPAQFFFTLPPSSNNTNNINGNDNDVRTNSNNNSPTTTINN